MKSCGIYLSLGGIPMEKLMISVKVMCFENLNIFKICGHYISQGPINLIQYCTKMIQVSDVQSEYDLANDLADDVGMTRRPGGHHQVNLIECLVDLCVKWRVVRIGGYIDSFIVMDLWKTAIVVVTKTLILCVNQSPRQCLSPGDTERYELK